MPHNKRFHSKRHSYSLPHAWCWVQPPMLTGSISRRYPQHNSQVFIMIVSRCRYPADAPECLQYADREFASDSIWPPHLVKIAEGESAQTQDDSAVADIRPSYRSSDAASRVSRHTWRFFQSQPVLLSEWNQKTSVTIQHQQLQSKVAAVRRGVLLERQSPSLWVLV